MEALTKKGTVVSGAGLCPTGAAVPDHVLDPAKEAAYGGTMGSPVTEMTGQYQSGDSFTKD